MLIRVIREIRGKFLFYSSGSPNVISGETPLSVPSLLSCPVNENLPPKNENLSPLKSYKKLGLVVFVTVPTLP